MRKNTFEKKKVGEMLIEQIIEYEWWGLGPLDRTCTLTTGYFHFKTKISKENLRMDYCLLGCIVFDFFFSKFRWLVIKSGTCMKKRSVQNFSEIEGAFEVPPGGGGVKIQILAKKRQYSKLENVMKTKIFLTWLEAKLQY